MEIRILVADPVDEPGDIRMPAQGGGAREVPFQLLVAERAMDGAVADRMDRHRLTPAATLGHRMMPFDPPAQRPLAEEADQIGIRLQAQ